MYWPECKEFHRFVNAQLTNAYNQATGREFKSVGTDSSGQPREQKLVCFTCVGKARRDVTNHGTFSAQLSNNYLGHRTANWGGAHFSVPMRSVRLYVCVLHGVVT